MGADIAKFEIVFLSIQIQCVRILNAGQIEWKYDISENE